MGQPSRSVGVYNTGDGTMAAATFEGFFFEHRDRLFAVLCVIAGNRHDAEELAQDAFVTMWERWDRVASLDDPVAYLYRIAINAFRKRVRRIELAKRITPMSAERSTPGPEDAVLLDDALQQLTSRQRAALVLTEMLGYTADEAAKLLNVKSSTIGALKYQGRAALRQGVERDA